MRVAALLAAVALAVVLAACGSSTKKQQTTAAKPALTPAEQAAAAKRRLRERPHYSTPDVQNAVMALPVAKRHDALIRALSASVLLDARQRVHLHQLRGPVHKVSCGITRDDKEYAFKHPTAPILRYDCLAVTFEAKTKPPMQLGPQFEARVDFSQSRYAWCLFTPVGGEGAHSASTFNVTPSPACVAPPGD